MNGAVKKAKTCKAASWCLSLGIFSMLCFGILTGVPAIICGHVALAKIKQSRGVLTGSGTALFGLILGYVGSVATTFVIMSVLSMTSFVSYKDRAYCASVEYQARNTAAAVSCYFADPEHNNIPTLAELISEPDCEYTLAEEVGISISGNLDQIQITAIDKIGKCKQGRQYVYSMPENSNDGWR